jgi:hypothetical protein
MLLMSQAASGPRHATSDAVLALDRLRVEARMRAGADWFFWIAALALLEAYLDRSGIVTEGAFGLGMTWLVERATEPWTAAGQAMPFLAELVLPVLYVLLGVLARRGRRWVFATGLIIYAVDAALVLAAGELIGLALHLVVLGLLGMGFLAARQLEQSGRAGATA